MIEADVLKAITHIMPCDRCPCPCDAKTNSSQANCDRHWFEILRLFGSIKWEDIRDELFDN